MTERTSRFVRYQLPALAWALCIFVSSSLPARVFPSLKIFQYDKAIHFTLFFILGLFVYRALDLFWGEKKFSLSRAFSAIVLVTLYGGLDEFHQRFVAGRKPDVWDATSDTIGGVAAMVIVFVYCAVRGVGNRPHS